MILWEKRAQGFCGFMNKANISKYHYGGHAKTFHWIILIEFVIYEVVNAALIQWGADTSFPWTNLKQNYVYWAAFK